MSGDQKYEKLTYREGTDGQMYPNVTADPTTYHYGKYGSLRKKWLKENCPITYDTWIVDGTLEQRLAEVDRKTRDAVEELVVRMLEEEKNAPDQMTDTIRWLALTDNLRKSAEELLLPDMIYS